ncbi:MAG: hypothetical protein ACE5F2_02105 [Candidatus Paceibacteria bacterium]
MKGLITIIIIIIIIVVGFLMFRDNPANDADTTTNTEEVVEEGTDTEEVVEGEGAATEDDTEAVQ